MTYHSIAQKQWTGGYGSSWSNGLNWQPAGIPGAADDVVLDNAFFKSDYVLLLPDTAVAIRSLQIVPAAGNHITLILPPSNSASPALRVALPGEAVVISNGGILVNASGLTGGSSLMITGTMRIENNGRYVHRTRSTHAADIVAKLSSAPGTEYGVFEFDIPGGSSSLSLSNRTFGTLVLAATASGGTQTYNAAGTSPVAIRGNLEISNGVTLNLDLTRETTINGSLMQQGGIFNIASQPNRNIIIVKGDVLQQAGSITETSTGLPVIELAGDSRQQLMLNGSITNSVTIRMNNQYGVTLATPVLLSYKLELLNGKVKTSASTILSIADDAIVTGASPLSFVDGPMVKIGDDDFSFPVGKQGDYAPVTITGSAGAVTDRFLSEYFLSNPQTSFGAAYEVPAISRISSLEYWKVACLSGTALKKVTLAVGVYSNATALNKLVVSAWDSGTATWTNAGMTAFNGIATGSITSNQLNSFGVFTLASTVEWQNPLPVTTTLDAGRINGRLLLRWKISGNANPDCFIIERSLEGNRFFVIKTIPAEPGSTAYSFQVADNAQGQYFRVRLLERNGMSAYTSIVNVTERMPDASDFHLLYTVVENTACLSVTLPQDATAKCIIYNMHGQVVRCIPVTLLHGNHIVPLNLPGLPSGMYSLTITGSKSNAGGMRFFKR